MSHNRKTERGQALILIALAAIGLFAFSALAIDGTRNFSNKRHAQNAADTSVMAAALKYIRTGSIADAKTAARVRATSNGYTHGTSAPGHTSTNVYVNLCSEEGTTDPDTNWVVPPCEGIEIAHKDQYIRVRIVDEIPATFGRVIGRQTLTTAAEAIARVQGGGSTSSGWPFTGAGMVAVKDGNHDQCLMMNGGGNLYLHDSGIVINCSGSKAWWMDGNSTLHMDADGKVAGCYYENGSSNWEYSEDPILCNQPSHVYTAADFASVPTTLSPPPCSDNGTIDSASAGSDRDFTGTPPSLTVKKGTFTINPGKWDTIDVGPDGILKMKPGAYCFSGNITVKAGGAISNAGTGSPVQMVLGDHSFLMNGSAGGGSSANFSDVEFYFDDGNYTQNSGSTFTAGRLRIFTTGTGNVDTNSTCTLSSNNAYIYLYRGDIIWNAQTTLHLEAPKPPDKFAGLVVYKPWGNTVETKFNGGSNVYLKGTFLAPTTHIIYNGGSNWELHSQVIAESFMVNANTDVDIYYVASDTYSPPGAPAALIQLTR